MKGVAIGLLYQKSEWYRGIIYIYISLSFSLPFLSPVQILNPESQILNPNAACFKYYMMGRFDFQPRAITVLINVVGLVNRRDLPQLFLGFRIQNFWLLVIGTKLLLYMMAHQKLLVSDREVAQAFGKKLKQKPKPWRRPITLAIHPISKMLKPS